MAFGFLKRLVKPVAKLFVKKGAKRTAQKTVQKGIKSGAKIAGKFDETIPMGFKPIQEIPKVGIPKQTLTKAQRLAAAKSGIAKWGQTGGSVAKPNRMAEKLARIGAKNKLTPGQEGLRTATQARKAFGTIKPAVQPKPFRPPKIGQPATQATIDLIEGTSTRGLSTGAKMGLAGVSGAGLVGIGAGIGINKKKNRK